VLAAQLAPVLLWIIWVGANDAVLPAYPHHVPLDKYKQNLKEMVSRIRAHGEGKILFITPPPIDVEMLKVHHRRKGNDRDAEVTKGYARACVEAAGELGVGVVDFWEVVKSRAGTNPRGWFTDGLHLGPKGYRALEETVMEFIGREWPELRPQNLPMMVSDPVGLRKSD
jgi:lysophospholipase L1-like esterase